ncbi:MAG: phosphatidylglycerol lysyltransferase domain-containing protein [Acidimicrobiia bacterium]|nr:phosphatidylglycerol lysyltransferase domain-containing protein [Acidimicrobiia bacterium]
MGPTRNPTHVTVRRTVAFVADFLLAEAGFLILVAAFTPDQAVDDGWAAVLVLIGIGLVFVVYKTLCEWAFGATPFKWLLGLRVADLDGNGIGAGAAIVRNALLVVEFYLVVFIGLFSVLADGTRRQRVGDVAAGTVVVAASAPAPLVLAERRETGKWVPPVLAGITVALGIWTMLTAVPFWWFRLRLSPIDLIADADVRGITFTASVVIGFAFVFLGLQLRKRKRRARQVAVVLLLVVTVVHALKGSGLVAGIVSAGLVAALMAARGQFRAPGDPPSLVGLARGVPVYLALVLTFGITALWLDRHRLEPAFTVPRAVEQTLAGLIGLDGPFVLHGVFGRFFPVVLVALGVGGITAVLIALFRPLIARPTHSAADWEHARRLVREYGTDTLSYFALRPDKSLFFASDGEAMIAYAYMGGYGLVSGDPIGRPGSVELVLDEFAAFCEERAWGMAVLAGREANEAMYAARGLSPYYLGDEAVVDVAGFTLEGRAIRKTRQSVNRMEKRGYSFELIADSDVSETLRGHLESLSAADRGKEPERGFTMALGEDVTTGDPACLVALARDSEHVPAGFLHLVPVHGDEPGYSLNLMRHAPGSPNGLTEYLVCMTLIGLKERGAHRLSLNFAMWSRLLDDDADLDLFERIQRLIVLRLNPYFQIESLKRFNEKFFPEWVPRCIYYDDRANLLRIGLLYAEVEAFVRVPFLRRTLAPRAGDVQGAAPHLAPAAR